MMIRLNDKFTAKHDGRQWVLLETYMGKSKDKPPVPKEQVRETYHSTLHQACKKVVETSVVDCEDAMDIIEALERAGWLLEGLASGYVEGA